MFLLRGRNLARMVALCLALTGAAVAWRYRDGWLPWLRPTTPTTAAGAVPRSAAEQRTLQLSPQARANLGLVSRPVRLQTYWRTILIPGEIADRPGVSDRGVTAPAVSVVTQVHAFPGDTVRPGDPLFTLRLLSEYIQNSQSELYKATRETELVAEQRERLASAAEEGAIPRARLFELDQQLRRLQASIESYRQDLLTRGLTEDQVATAAEGQFVASVDVVAPARLPISDHASAKSQAEPAGDADALEYAYEIQELKVDLGMQVQAGQLLGVLADHRWLYLEGHAFKQDAPALELAAQQDWAVEVEFAEDDASTWPELAQDFRIHHLANSIDRASRTFDFFLVLENQSRSFDRDGRTLLVWRYRPGQRVRLHVPVEELRDVIVLPIGAVVRDGPEAYVFRQNGDLFDRRPVRVLHEDRLHVVLANDGSVAPGWYLAQHGAAALNRVLKAQAASGQTPGVHMHADGTVHGAH